MRRTASPAKPARDTAPGRGCEQREKGKFSVRDREEVGKYGFEVTTSS